jgi:hypothetical protein
VSSAGMGTTATPPNLRYARRRSSIAFQDGGSIPPESTKRLAESIGVLLLVGSVSLNCSRCGGPFVKAVSEYRRRLRAGHREFYCSRSCGVAAGNRKGTRGGDVSILKADNRRDLFTPFRWFVLRARQRQRKHGPPDITVEYLSDLWTGQKGRCPLTGWSLVLPDSTLGWKRGAHVTNASLDRIDGGLGYLQGNVRFVSVMANLARASFLDRDLSEFCAAVVRHDQGRSTSRT